MFKFISFARVAHVTNEKRRKTKNKSPKFFKNKLNVDIGNLEPRKEVLKCQNFFTQNCDPGLVLKLTEQESCPDVFYF